MRIRGVFAALGLCGLLLVKSGPANAAAVFIDNWDFQADLTLNFSTAQGDYDYAAVGWSITANQTGTYEPAIGAGLPYTTGVTGNRVGFLNDGTLTQILGAAFEANTNYTLTFDVGHRNDTGFPTTGTATIFDATSNSILATVLLSDPGLGAFTNQQIVLSAAAVSGAVGNQIGVAFESPSVQVNIDNVRLDAALVPLPSAVFLFASGMGIIAWTSRMRAPGRRA